MEHIDFTCSMCKQSHPESELCAGMHQGIEDSELNELLCVVSPHEKGFWQADIYLEGWAEGLIPDWFCTGKVGGTKDDVIAKAKEAYPGVKIIDGITGICIDCGEEYFELEQECADCGGIVGDT